ncbi:MAG TPA: hypothetical protein VKM72_03695 [Thermoanaerobaculia bacterium]|nr:hypothetical protein [Thermoanaerobaculia bacterium]
MSSTKEDGGAFDATEASFLRGDFLGLLAWRALRESISAASLRPGQTFELTGPSVLGLFGSTLPLATRAVLTLRQVPAAGESAFFEIVTDLAPESSGAESHSLRGTARIDLSTTRIEVRLSEDRTEKTKIEFTDREVVAKHHRDIEIRRTIERPETPTGG